MIASNLWRDNMNEKLSQQVKVYVIACSGPADLNGVRMLVDKNELNPNEIVAVMGKTEGNGGVNDFARDLAVKSWCTFLCAYFNCSPESVLERVALVMSGGTEGVLSPHFTVFTRSFIPFLSSSEKGLVIGISHTKKFLPEEIGTMAQVLETAKAVKLAMQDAGLNNSDDIHLVQVKCPLLTNEKINNLLIRGAMAVTQDTYKSMAYSRAASALGVAIALGDARQNEIDNSTILSDFNKYSGCASISAGIEVDNNVVIVFGNLVGSSSPYFISHTIMHDSIDIKSVLEMFSNDFGLDLLKSYSVISDRLVNIFVKAEASPDGLIRGERHTMLTDSDVTSTRHARAAVGGVLAALTGKTTLYVSGGAEHQGPSGGGTCAAIIKRK